MLLVAMLINALHTPFEDAEIAFDSIGVNLAPDILFGGMIDGVMLRNVTVRTSIKAAFIGMQVAFAGDIPHHDRGYSLLIGIIDME